MPGFNFAINRSCAPGLGLDGFISLAKVSGVRSVEIRNDIAGRESANGQPARDLRRRLAEAGLTVSSINALQRFNDWTDDRAAEAQAVITYAAELGAAVGRFVREVASLSV